METYENDTPTHTAATITDIYAWVEDRMGADGSAYDAQQVTDLLMESGHIRFDGRRQVYVVELHDDATFMDAWTTVIESTVTVMVDGEPATITVAELAGWDDARLVALANEAGIAGDDALVATIATIRR
jgi:hypothetical protein